MHTTDHEDHTFSGIMWDLECKADLPVDYVELTSVWVRGDLGPMAVYWTPGTFLGNHERARAWRKVHESTRRPSMEELVELTLDPPVRVPAGGRVGLYVHSRNDGGGSLPDSVVCVDRARASRGRGVGDGRS